MRGTRHRRRRAGGNTGIIPAYAGNTLQSLHDSFQRRDHPRVCGEHAIRNHIKNGEQGSSPRMRGTHEIAVGDCLVLGIIPAYAGNTLMLTRCRPCSKDHPRVCGEHKYTFAREGLTMGSSPRMRGTHPSQHRPVRQSGIIPAYAGNTSRKLTRYSMFRDHPRVCGEHDVLVDYEICHTGSSPRMRGTHAVRVGACDIHGIIPAYAGNTRILEIRWRCARDHPRVCGEHDDYGTMVML